MMGVSENSKAMYDEINIDNLILKAKHFQNQNSISLVESAKTIKSPWNSELPPVFDNVMIQDYVEGIVGDYLSEDSTTIGLRKNIFSEHENANDSHNTEEINVNEAAVDNQLNICTELALVDEDIQVEWEPVIRSIPSKNPPKKIVLPISPGTTRTTEFRKKCIQDSNSNRNSCRTVQKTPRVQYSLFTGNAKGFTTINFSKEHPDLGLDSSHEYNTLFPRRYAIKPQENLTNLTSKERSPLNILDNNKLVPEIENPVDKTWREELLTKKSRKKIKKKKKIRVKVKAKALQAPIENADLEMSLPELLEPTTLQKESILTSLSLPNEQITPSLPPLEIAESSERLLNSAPKTQESHVIYDTPIVHNIPTFSQIKTKFQIQNFPVLCIRGAFKIQKVVSISIEGDNCKKSLTSENTINRNNVQYLEFVHNDKKVDFIPVEILSEDIESTSQIATKTLQDEKPSKDHGDIQSNENNTSVNMEPRINKFYKPFKDMTNLISQDEALSKSKFITTYSSSKEFNNSSINSSSASDLSCYSTSTQTDSKNFEELKAKRIVRKRKPLKGFIARDNTLKRKDISCTEENRERNLQMQPQTFTTQLPTDAGGCKFLYEENKREENECNSSEDARHIFDRVLTLPEKKHCEQNDKWEQAEESNVENISNNFNSTTKLDLHENYKYTKKQNQQYLDEIFQQIENGELVCLKTFKDRHKEQLHRSNSSSSVKFTEIPHLNVLAPHLPLKAQQCFDIEEYNCCLYSRPVTERDLNLPLSDKVLQSNRLFERINDPRSSSTSSSDLGIHLDGFTSENTSNRIHKSSIQEFDSKNHVTYERTLNSLRLEEFRTSQKDLTQKRTLSSSSDPEVQTAVNKFIRSLYSSPNSSTKLDNLDCTYLLCDKVNKTNHNVKSSDISFSSSHLPTNRSNRKRKTFLSSEPVLSSSTVSLLTTFKEVAKSDKKVTHFHNSDKCLGNNLKNKSTEPIDLRLKPSLVHSNVDYDSNLLSSSFSSISLNLDLSQLKESSSSSSSKKLTSWKQLTKSSKTFSCNSDGSDGGDSKPQISSGDETCNSSKVVSHTMSMSEGEVLSLGEV